ncbi:hypothetical protein LB542_15885 [Mesorhizobium sp. BR1-1-9]|uniref:hypothetical protein n=1 Tax=unclassified Mesorhizobium TaxID=325217 RepID=UPI0011299AA7|nr:MULTISPECIES: hypothetical protein [unclassified Mesorhizobium]MBZ9811096.1 hypothetical protein [Mesorhizobium sp. ESP-6-2]MBZ9872331.1 hypothetical protein [Mesorhizobium sp. BR1-1-9]MBZ9944671.1 hypothetical protein [Mesorhizobium sp. BR1-1-13]TPM22602.1 hypothetical protein FJ955_28565 [Mesorhizobium sp. B2-2-2]
MNRFKEALERGKTAHREQEEDGNASMADFGTQARAWLNDVVVASLEAARAEVAGEMTIDIDTAPRRRGGVLMPSVRFRLYRKPGLKKTAKRAFTVNVQLSGEVSVSSPGMVAEAVGNIGDRSPERFRNLVVRLIENVAKGV